MAPRRSAVQDRLLGLYAALLVMSSTGGAYVFAVYSKAIKATFGYDRKTLATLSAFKNLGASLGVFPGLINEVAAPWVVLLCGGGMNLAGYLPVYIAVSGGHTAAQPPPVWSMCLCVAVGANSQSFASAAALVTAANNFPGNRGDVISLLMGFAGVSGAIFVHLHRSFYGAGDSGAGLVLLLALIPTTIQVLSIPAIRVIPRNDAAAPARGERKAFFLLLANSLLIGLCLLVLNVMELSVSGGLPRPVYYVSAVVILAILLLPSLVIFVVNKQESGIIWVVPPTTTTSESTSSDKTPPEDSEACMLPGPVVPTPTSAASAAPHPPPSCMFKNVFRPPPRGQDYSIPQALFSADMLLLSITTALGLGGMLTAIDNIGQIGQSLGYPEDRTAVLVSMVSVANYAGRAAVGLGAEFLLASRYKVPRPVALTVTQLLAFAGHVIIASGVGNGLYVASPIMGFCVGAQWTVLFAIVSELFGVKHFSTLYNLSAIPSALGSYFLNVHVTGRLYNKQEATHLNLTSSCVGVQCFRESFAIIAGLTLLGAAVSGLLVWRTRAFYRAGGVAAATTTNELRGG